MQVSDEGNKINKTASYVEGLHGGRIDFSGSPLVESERRESLLQSWVDARTESRDDEVALEADELILINAVFTIIALLHLVQLESDNVSVLDNNLLGLHVWHEFAPLLLCQLALFRHCPHIGDTTPERNNDAVCSAPERRSGAVEGSVTSTKNHYRIRNQ